MQLCFFTGGLGNWKCSSYLFAVTNDAELEVAALTSNERKHWAQVRKTYFSEGSNKDSLETIEESLFMVWFD